MEKYGYYKHAPLCLCASATFDIDNVDCILYLQFCSYKRYLYLDEKHCDQCMFPFTRYMINNITKHIDDYKDPNVQHVPHYSFYVKNFVLW